MNSVAVVIPSWNTRALLVECLTSLARTRVAMEVVVVDNNSQDGSAQAVSEHFPQALVIRNARNEGFARACNQGIAASTAPFVLLLNSDAQLREGCLEGLLDFLRAQPRYAAAAPRLEGPDGNLQRAMMNFPRPRTALFFGTPLERWAPHSAELRRYFARDFDYDADGDVEQPPAAALLLRRAALDAPDGVGGFDESLWLYFNDVDLSLRLARAGWRTRYLHAAIARHVGGASTSRLESRLEHWHADRLRYFRKHFGRACGWWVKACTTWAWLDACGSALFRATDHPAGGRGTIAPLTRAFARFLAA